MIDGAAQDFLLSGFAGDVRLHSLRINFLMSTMDLPACATIDAVVASPSNPEAAAIFAVLYFEFYYFDTLRHHRYSPNCSYSVSSNY